MPCSLRENRRRDTGRSGGQELDSMTSRHKEHAHDNSTCNLHEAHCTRAGSDRVVRRHPGHGRIIFGRFDPAVGDFHLLMVTPDGTDEVLLLPGVA